MATNILVESITSHDPAIRNKSFELLCKEICSKETHNKLVEQFLELEQFRKASSNLYEKVRASIFLYYGYRFILQESDAFLNRGKINPVAHEYFLNREFEKGIEKLLEEAKKNGYNSVIFSSLANCYHKLTFKILADQVKRSVKQNPGNRWMFRVGEPEEHPLHFHPVLMKKNENLLFPILSERTAVRMDLSHSCWSDIFFLGMDFPEGARVINISVDIGVFGRDKDINPPIETYLRIIDEPVIRLVSLDLKASKDISDLEDLFNFGNDYLSLLKAAVIASGVIPPSFEGATHKLTDILSYIIAPGCGFELVTKVNDIPKGSRLAVSTNLLASMISLLMRGTGQTLELTGSLNETERRVIASRAILGEWLGGSGGGWQDSGGIWPGIKRIEGEFSKEGDPEFGISRGSLLPRHTILMEEIHPEFEERLISSLVLMHGGMSSNVGPILEMVTEKYLLRLEDEWKSRNEAISIYNHILECIKDGDIKKLASLTTKNFDGPIKTIIPAATNAFTEKLISTVKEVFGEDYWGFLMFGGISGGGMGMFFNPIVYEEAKVKLLEILHDIKNKMQYAVPFAMEPVVYNFKINKRGSFSELLSSNNSLMPNRYYNFTIPNLLNGDLETLSDTKKRELDIITSKMDGKPEGGKLLKSITQALFKQALNVDSSDKVQNDFETEKIKRDNGFDAVQHQELRQDLIKGKIGLSRNRLSAETRIEDVGEDEIERFEKLENKIAERRGYSEIEKVGVFILAAGAGTRWTKGAGVIKAINPFVNLREKHRSFLEIHIAKARKLCRETGINIPIIISSSYLTNEAIKSELKEKKNYDYEGEIFISEGRSIGQRFIPMERDLRFLWEETPQEQLDENKQKVLNAVRASLIDWAKTKGEGSDYRDNIPLQRLAPLGHWFEFPNTLRNGTLKKLITSYPKIENILLHNIDTLGAGISGELLDFHIRSQNVLTFEVIPRRVDDKGGGLAKVNGKIRLLEGLAQPDDKCEYELSYYNSMSTWINIDRFLNLFGLNREKLFTAKGSEIDEAVRSLAKRIPSYVTIKDVKYRWGFAQEDIYPVAQVEKLWSDMTALPECKCGFVVVPRKRGQQLKDPAQLDAWLNDGSKEYVEGLCEF